MIKFKLTTKIPGKQNLSCHNFNIVHSHHNGNGILEGMVFIEEYKSKKVLLSTIGKILISAIESITHITLITLLKIHNVAHDKTLNKSSYPSSPHLLVQFELAWNH